MLGTTSLDVGSAWLYFFGALLGFLLVAWQSVRAMKKALTEHRTAEAIDFTNRVGAIVEEKIEPIRTDNERTNKRVTDHMDDEQGILTHLQGSIDGHLDEDRAQFCEVRDQFDELRKWRIEIDKDIAILRAQQGSVR